jgi:hypothetical protein
MPQEGPQAWKPQQAEGDAMIVYAAIMKAYGPSERVFVRVQKSEAR